MVKRFGFAVLCASMLLSTICRSDAATVSLSASVTEVSPYVNVDFSNDVTLHGPSLTSTWTSYQVMIWGPNNTFMQYDPVDVFGKTGPSAYGVEFQLFFTNLGDHTVKVRDSGDNGSGIPWYQVTNGVNIKVRLAEGDPLPGGGA